MDQEGTEEKIKKAARQVFTQKGMYGARMQEIADKAGINKALLHYYYRNKDQLFVAVFQDIMKDMIPKLLPVFSANISIHEKVEKLSDIYINFLKENQDLPLFILYELHQNPDRLVSNMSLKVLDRFRDLQIQLDEEAKKGNIRPIKLQHFMANLLSMMVFPFIARPLLKGVLGLDQKEFEDLMEERKREIPTFIMNALEP